MFDDYRPTERTSFVKHDRIELVREFEEREEDADLWDGIKRTT